MERQTNDGVVLGHHNSHAHYPGNEWSEYHIDLLSTSAITLRPGWNLVGYQGAQTTDITTALNSLGATYDIVFGFDQSRGGVTSYFTDPNKDILNNLSSLTPMNGYWLHIKGTSTQTWVPW